MNALQLLAPAKVNLFLEVVARRPDGYHDIESVMQTVSLYDRLTFTARPRGLSLTCSLPGLATDDSNLVLRAARALQRATGCRRGAAIHLDKQIPLGAGLGGGSSDAAATLTGLMGLWGVRLPRPALVRLAASLGADVPFFLSGGRAIARGIGDRLTPLAPGPKRWYILVNPGFPVPTPWVYRNLRFPLTKRHNISKIIKLFNRLEEVVLPHHPPLRRMKEALSALGIRSLMSGSGATVFGVLSSESQGIAAQRALARRRWRTWVVHSV